MTENVKKPLKERSKLTKYFYMNGQRKEDHEKLLAKANNCMKEILETKNEYIFSK